MRDAGNERSPGTGGPALLVSLVVVLAIALLAYLPSLRFELVWDDPMLLALVRERLQEGGLWRLLTSEFLLGPGTAATGYYRPVVLLSLLLDGSMGGGAPLAYHATNVLLHATCSAMFLILARRALPPTASVAAALLFALHPAHVEAVAFVSGRTDLLAALFVLAATLLWLRCRDRGKSALSWEGAASTVCLFLGALSKEVALLLPLVFTTWEFLPDGKERSSREATGDGWRRRTSWWASWAVAIGAVAVLRMGLAEVGWGAAPEPATAAAGVSFFTLLGLRIMGYLRLLILPWPPSPFYTASDLTPGPAWVAGAAAAGLALALAWRLLPRRSAWMWNVWLAVFLVPVLGIVPTSGGVLAERFLYLPSAGFCLVLGGWHAWSRRFSRPAAANAAAAIVILLGAAGTLAAQDTWRDEATLFARMVRTSPRAFVARFNLGNTLTKAGKLREAEAELTTAVTIAPLRSDAWNNLGAVRERLGDPPGAVEAYRKASDLTPGNRLFAVNFGNALMRLGRAEEAEAAFRRALDIDPADAGLLVQLATLLADRGQAAEAEGFLVRAVRVAPDRADARNYLGFLLLSRGLAREAEEELRAAARLDPSHPVVRYNLALALLAQDKVQEARAEADSLRALDAGLSAQLETLLRRTTPTSRWTSRGR